MRRINIAQAPGKVARAARNFPCWGASLQYTSHALKGAREDRYGNIEPFLPAHLSLSDSAVCPVEVEMDDCGATTKVVLRLRTGLHCGADAVDAVLVLVREDGPLVKTVWGNLRTDNHATLKTSRLYS